MKFTYGTGVPIKKSGLETEYNEMKEMLSDAIKNNISFSGEISVNDEKKNPLIMIDYDSKKCYLEISYIGCDNLVDGLKRFINMDKGLSFIDKTFEGLFKLVHQYNEK